MTSSPRALRVAAPGRTKLADVSLLSRAVIPAVLAVTCVAATPVGWVTRTLDGFELDHPPDLDVTVLPATAMLRRRPWNTSPWTLVFGIELVGRDVQSPLSEGAQLVQDVCFGEIRGGSVGWPEIRRRQPFQTDSGTPSRARTCLRHRHFLARTVTSSCGTRDGTRGDGARAAADW